MVFALSTGHEIGLAVTGAAFIVFALISSFVLPSRNANFPGRYRNLYLLLCIAFFAAMMSAVVVFGREKKEASAAAATGTTPTQTAPAGNAAAGKTQFSASGCSACHTFHHGDLLSSERSSHSRRSRYRLARSTSPRTSSTKAAAAT